MLVKERFEVLSQEGEIGAAMIQNLHDLFIEGECIEQVLQTEKSVTTRRCLSKGSFQR
jgi:hypothetical protein